MEPIVSKSLPVSLNQHRSHGPIFQLFYPICDISQEWYSTANISGTDHTDHIR